jgi:putative inorganic carbon (HCO3(-)) transporter
MGPPRPVAARLPVLGIASVAAAGGAICFAAAATGHLEASRFGVLAAGIAGLSGVYLAWHVAPAYVFSVAIALSVFAGNWGGMGLPNGAAPDRFVLLVGILALLFRSPGAGERRLPRFRAAHWALVGTSVYAIASALVVGTLLTSDGGFRLLDRLGLVPFAMFFLAPVVFRSQRERMILLATLVGIGAYLGLTALFQTIGVPSLVFPKYILDPSFGLHFDRARGPFVEAEANGLALYGCGVAAVVASVIWKRTGPRLFAIVTAVLCAAGTLFTLQRAVWIGAALATLLALVGFQQLRRYVVIAAVVLPAIVLISFAVVPGLESKALTRAQDERPVWDRQNLNAAAIRMIEARPLLGFGWQQFHTHSPEYFQQASTYPLTGTKEPLHSAFLSNAVELGIPGTILWLVAIVLAVGGAIARRGPPALEPWRIGLLAYAVMWIVVANFTPLERPFVSILLMVWAGVVWAGRDPGPRRHIV